ncbi:MAG: UTP--glucose-1-phosphate uridylyltransferase [Pirellulales bacterium]|nr:UTP--glucose-1-phosphate uridylyltransferase [Pirellulales bacterium]
MDETLAQLQSLLAPFGQTHLLDFWDRLTPEERNSLEAEIRAIDFGQIARLFEKREAGEDLHEMIERAGPPPALRLDGQNNRFSADEARSRGREAMQAGQIGVILVAGGQGTRLGFPHPKGMFPIGPVSGNSLFQIHIEKILADSRRYGVSIPLYIMTSPATHDETVEFLDRNDRFGLAKDQLTIFRQGTMPAVDDQSGKVLLVNKSHLALSPDGHGGMLDAFAKSGAMDAARDRGIRQLFYFQVDNPLVDICGLDFLGYHLLSGSEFSSQVIAKRDPLDRVGNIVRLEDERLLMVEYSDLPEKLAHRRNPDGSLEIWAGSIAVHVMDLEFLNRMAKQTAAGNEALPFHTARKKVDYLDRSGRTVRPDEPNAIKFERFIFDLLPSAADAIAVEVDPQRAFAPLKNAPGDPTDTPESVKAQLVAQAKDWLQRAGIEVSEGVKVEISPLFARNETEVAKKIPAGTQVTQDRYFC